jgi:hypothetical protein
MPRGASVVDGMVMVWVDLAIEKVMELEVLWPWEILIDTNRY